MSGTDYVYDRFHRACDICGTPRKASELRLSNSVWICYRHKGFRTAKELDKLNARKRIPIAPIRRGTQPLALRQTWEAQEARILDLIITVAPFQTYSTTSDGAPGITGTRSVRAAGWAAVYLYSVIAEGRRPAAWITQAKTKLTELADYLLTQQVTTPSVPQYGAFGASNWTAQDVGICCLALCRAYQVFGTVAYLDAAKLAANAAVNFTATNLLTSSPTTKFYGPQGTILAGANLQRQFDPQSMTCQWGMSVLLSIAGDGTYGDPGTAGGFFTSSPARLLSVSLAQAITFWTTGATDEGTTGDTVTLVNGLTGTTPRGVYDASVNVWSSGSITTLNWAMGLRCLYEVAGSSAQITGAVAYLQVLTQSPSSAMPDGTSQKVLLQGRTGEFDPTIAPPDTFNPLTAQESSSFSGFYDLSAAGLLAPLVGATSLESTKEAIAIPRPRTAEGTPRDGRTQFIGRLGLCGYSFQPYSGVSARNEVVSRAAQVGLMYRVGMGAHS